MAPLLGFHRQHIIAGIVNLPYVFFILLIVTAAGHINKAVISISNVSSGVVFSQDVTASHCMSEQSCGWWRGSTEH